MKPINALRLAEKLHRIAREDGSSSILKTHPRFREIVWFLHWQSFQPGGLARFVDRFLESHPAAFGLPAGSPVEEPAWNLEQCLPVWEQERARHERSAVGCGHGAFIVWAVDKDLEADQPPLSRRPMVERDTADLEGGVHRFNRDYFASAYHAEARERLPALFVDLCERPDCEYFAPSYHPKLYTALCDFIDGHAALTRQSIASTRVTEMVFKRLDFVRSSNEPALILGDARIGKTKSESTFAVMYPGQARVVTTPSDDTMTAFIYAHADALGLDYTPSTSTKALKYDIEFIIANSGLLFLYDESHYLVPQNYTAKTPPERMNWVRGRVIDLGLGVAFFSTRQSYQASMAKYGRKTQYQFEQWIGRIAPPLILPAGLDSSELLAAAKVMFAAVDADLLEIVVQRCAVRGTGLQELGGAVRYAIFLAQRDGRIEPNLDDVDGAFKEFLGESEERLSQPSRRARESAAQSAPSLRVTKPISSVDQALTTDARRGVALV